MGSQINFNDFLISSVLQLGQINLSILICLVCFNLQFYFSFYPTSSINASRLSHNNNLFSLEIRNAENMTSHQEFCSPFTKEELEVSIERIKNTSPGHDQITNLMIKSLNHNYIDEILMLFNQSYTTGVMPRTWKIGQVIPIHKANKPKTEVSSYHPITLLPCIGKLLERLIQRRLEYLLENDNLLLKEQYGFRPGKSTIDILNTISCKVKTRLQNKIVVLF